jgi:hypothetical protein
MRSLRSLCAALLLTLASCGTALGADDITIERGVTVDKNAAAEKGDRTPVLQYALAGALALSVLVIVCMPSRKAH